MKKIFEKIYNCDDCIYLNYDKLPIIIYGKELPGGYYDPPEWEEFEEEVDYELEVSMEEAVTFVIECILSAEDYDELEEEAERKNADPEEYIYKKIEDNMDFYIEKFEKDFLDYFEEEATEKAQEENQERYYDYDDGPDPDYYYELRRDEGY